MEFRHMTKYFPHGFSDLVKVINQKKLKVLGNSSFIDVLKKKKQMRDKLVLQRRFR